MWRFQVGDVVYLPEPDRIYKVIRIEDSQHEKGYYLKRLYPTATSWADALAFRDHNTLELHARHATPAELVLFQ